MGSNVSAPDTALYPSTPGPLTKQTTRMGGLPGRGMVAAQGERPTEEG